MLALFAFGRSPAFGTLHGYSEEMPAMNILCHPNTDLVCGKQQAGPQSKRERSCVPAAEQSSCNSIGRAGEGLVLGGRSCAIVEQAGTLI